MATEASDSLRSSESRLTAQALQSLRTPLLAACSHRLAYRVEHLRHLLEELRRERVALGLALRLALGPLCAVVHRPETLDQDVKIGQSARATEHLEMFDQAGNPERREVPPFADVAQHARPL